MVGRRDVLDALDRALDATAAGAFRFVALVGEPGAGKTRLLGELLNAAADRKLPAVAGRAAEFEQDMPFGVVIDALDDHLEEHRPDLGPAAGRLLATVFPSMAVSGDAPADGAEDPADLTGLARYRLYRTVRRLLEELAAPAGLVLVLDDVHWADDASVELLEHLVRHPPRARVMVAVAYRPAQAAPRLATLVDTAGAHGLRVPVEPLTRAEVAEFLGPQVPAPQRDALYAASGGNPFYLEALARMGVTQAPGRIGEEGAGELPPAVEAALQAELSGLPDPALLVARAAAVAADEFEPSLAAAAAEVPESTALAALDELAARDVVRPASGGRFRFRHPLVRHATYGSAAAGWRVGVHARVADHLARLGVPATVRARHVERSGRFGDTEAIDTLVEAARTVAPHAPQTAAHWLKAALKLMPDADDRRLPLLAELAKMQAISGQLAEGRRTGREVLRLLPPDAHALRARAARFCAMMERLLGDPHQARGLLLAELRRMPDPRSAAAVMLRLRLVAESLLRVDFRAAQAVLDMVPDNADGWEPGLVVAVAALRPMPAYAGGRVEDALRHCTDVDRLVAASSDEHLAEWLDAITWSCWTELFLGRYDVAAGRLERVLSVARATGQSYIVPTALAGQANAYAMLGRLAEAATAAEEAEAVARMLASDQLLVFALTQRCLVASWLGNDEDALAYGREAVQASGGTGEWWGRQAAYALGVATVHAGDTETGAAMLREVCADSDTAAALDPSAPRACEILAQLAAAAGDAAEAARWADRTAATAPPALPGNRALVDLARAHALRPADPAAAARRARQAAATLEEAGHRLDAGRARLYAGIAAAEAGDRGFARAELRIAAEIFEAAGARPLHARTQREQRRVGVRVPARGAGTGSGGGPGALSRRELQVARLVAEGCTNQQIAERLYLSIRTVETHLSHIFAKLGVSSRVAVVNALGRLEESGDGG
ncbi:ATP-binding protein [Thermomonospora cellulosilytica]|uniref:ATP/maltotriose-dependent transcriptional regulator MalT n=1 Tax=Thermomonospora cellulosilytica TaxID=1411118 RepID=A0A7W3MZS9_9ACTN|nr:LuxR family transcriptional regulator [Thermomonospora cellulosilytica]MBA9004917.1 ATP/maltotriose-dependent transcriptional regulator MalT [Thermomonospora cellulosilytica]